MGLKDAESLGTVSLVGTKITGVGFRALPRDVHIKSLDMSETKLNEAGLRELAALECIGDLIVDTALVPVAAKIFLEAEKTTTISDQTPKSDDFW